LFAHAFGTYAQDIHEASSKGDIDRIKAILEKNPDSAKQRN
jgi:hypothetical protein